MGTFAVKNESGQVAVFSIEDNRDPRKEVLEQRIKRGELSKASAKDESAAVGRPRQVVEDYHTGMKDEKGDLLKSVHGGGLDPDADGDELGQPSGSKSIKGAARVEDNEPVGDSHPDAAEAKSSRRKS